mmetsp:Transcript_113133/g.320184  ORF Transcript_113133/g.320184 Transcript_113133/m.320184 type:complete len:214 (+) Transcript_113133:1821-2462(+)
MPRCFHRIGPEQVEEQTVLDSLGVRRWTTHMAMVDGVHEAQVRRRSTWEPSVHDEDFIVHGRCQGQHLEYLHELPVDVLAILAHALVEEPASLVGGHHIHVLVLVVASEEEDGLALQKEEREDEEENLARVGPSIRDISVEEINVLRARHTMQKEDEQDVLQLAMGIANDDDPTIARHAESHERPRVSLWERLGDQVEDLVHVVDWNALGPLA